MWLAVTLSNCLSWALPGRYFVFSLFLFGRFPFSFVGVPGQDARAVGQLCQKAPVVIKVNVQEFILQPANGVNVKGQQRWHNENHTNFPQPASHASEKHAAVGFPSSGKRYRVICKQLPKVMNYAQLACRKNENNFILFASREIYKEPNPWLTYHGLYSFSSFLGQPYPLFSQRDCW